jgi:hypothetical protein
MEEEFYATIKLTSGEELVGKVSYDSDDDVIIIFNPKIVIRTEIKKKGIKIEGFEFQSWIQATHEDMFIIPRSQIITMIETDGRIVSFYEQHLQKKQQEEYMLKNGGIPGNRQDSKIMDGYISSTKEARSILEQIYNKS